MGLGGDRRRRRPPWWPSGRRAVYVWWVHRAGRPRCGAAPARRRRPVAARRRPGPVLPHGGAAGSLTVATAVAAASGTVDLAAHQVAFEIWSFLALALDAIAIAGQSITGLRLGAGDGRAPATRAGACSSGAWWRGSPASWSW